MPSLKNKSLFRQQAYINGQWCDADSNVTMAVKNPASGATIGTVPRMGAAETSRAIEAAKNAWEKWRSLTAKERSVILLKWSNLLIENADDLACLMTCEQGKPLQEARSEVVYAASFLEWFSEEGKRVCGDTLQSPWADKRIIVLKEPIGVCAAITPWNFPAAMITRKVGPALAAGCPIVVKPAEKAPYSALALAVLAEMAGVPMGVFSVVTGDPVAIGSELTSNVAVRKVSFTGSTRVGRLLMEQSASTIKKVSLELGGNASFIVFEDADLDAAVDGVMSSKFRNSGQTCVCANRIFVHDKIYDDFSEKLIDKVKKLGLQEVVWVNCGGKSSVCRVKNDVSWVARN